VVEAQGVVLDRSARELRQIFGQTKMKFDLTILTVDEFAEKPLRDFNELVPLWERPTAAPS